MKKIKTYNLSIDVIESIEKLAIEDRRSASDWLDFYLYKQLVKKDKKLPKSLAINSCEDEFNMVWEIYGKKGNKKTSKARFSKLTNTQKKLMACHLKAYIDSTPDKQFRKNLETYINQECWNDEVLENGQGNKKRIKTTSDRYAEQSARLQERESQAAINSENTAPLQVAGRTFRR